MTFRWRMVLAAAVVGIFAILAASLGAYLASRNALINSVDDVLQSTVSDIGQLGGVGSVEPNGRVSEITTPYVQFYTPSAPPSSPALPVNSSVRAVANGHARSYATDIRVDGAQWREYVTHYQGPARLFGFPFFGSGALQVAAPLTGVNDQLGGLGLGLLLVALAALTLTILIGWFVSRTAVEPLNELTAAVEELARTTNVTERLEPGGQDELGRLRSAFNRLLAALESSRESQQQLVMDASHELRTPLTSLRTNLEIVRRFDELSEPERDVLVADVLTQMQELTNLVGDLAELARGDRTEQEASTFRLDQLIEDVVQLAASHGRQRAVAFRTDLEVVWVHGRRDRISRAIGNLLDNALKWSPDGAAVDVLCGGGDIAVRDRGPGIDPEDLPHIFDRFYRARAARARFLALGSGWRSWRRSRAKRAVRSGHRTRRTAVQSSPCTFRRSQPRPTPPRTWMSRTPSTLCATVQRPKQGCPRSRGSELWVGPGPMDTLKRPPTREARPRRAHPARWVAALVVLVAAIGVPLGVLGRQKKTIVLMGDSLTAISVPVIGPYFSLLGYGLQPAALSGSGILDTRVNWLAHARQLVAQYDPSVVVVEFIGDYGFGGERPGVAPDSPAFFQEWGQVAQQLEDILTSRGAKVYWVIGPPVSNPVLEATIARLDSIYEHLHAPDTTAGHPPLINVTPALTGGSGRYTEFLPGPGGVPVEVRTPDGTHFTVYGAALYGRAIAQAIGAAPRV